MFVMRIIRLVLSLAITLFVVLTAISFAMAEPMKDALPLPDNLIKKMQQLNVDPAAPIYIRAFKEEGVLEVWKEDRNGRYQRIAVYEICKWSGKLGPKYRQGDLQTPEGFYTVAYGQMHPKSNYHLAFNIGFPNAYDRANGRDGSYLMVHGNCLSVGCYAMTDRGIEQIYAFAREAFTGGQKAFSFHAFPFRMSGENMARYAMDANMPFWTKLKIGYDVFEITKQPPRIETCAKDYVVGLADNQESRKAFCQKGDDGLIDTLDVHYNHHYMMDYVSALANPPDRPLMATNGFLNLAQ